MASMDSELKNTEQNTPLDLMKIFLTSPLPELKMSKNHGKQFYYLILHGIIITDNSMFFFYIQIFMFDSQFFTEIIFYLYLNQKGPY